MFQTLNKTIIQVFCDIKWIRQENTMDIISFITNTIIKKAELLFYTVNVYSLCVQDLW